jgi:hypothetical protein
MVTQVSDVAYEPLVKFMVPGVITGHNKVKHFYIRFNGENL